MAGMPVLIVTRVPSWMSSSWDHHCRPDIICHPMRRRAHKAAQEKSTEIYPQCLLGPVTILFGCMELLG